MSFFTDAQLLVARPSSHHLLGMLFRKREIRIIVQALRLPFLPLANETQNHGEEPGQERIFQMYGEYQLVPSLAVRSMYALKPDHRTISASF